MFFPFAVASVISFAFSTAAAAVCFAGSVAAADATAPARSTLSTSATPAHHVAIASLSAAEPPGIVQAITVVIGRAALMRVTAFVKYANTLSSATPSATSVSPQARIVKSGSSAAAQYVSRPSRSPARVGDVLSARSLTPEWLFHSGLSVVYIPLAVRR